MARLITLGTFDLFHIGHVRLLERCRKLGTHVTVGLNTDEFVQRYKGARPVIPYEDRAGVLLACRYVDHVVPNAQPGGSAGAIIERSGAQIIAVGDDWKDRDYEAQLGITSDWLAERHIRVVYLPYTPGIAGPSSAIKRRIQETR